MNNENLGISNERNKEMNFIGIFAQIIFFVFFRHYFVDEYRKMIWFIIIILSLGFLPEVIYHVAHLRAS